MNKALLLFLPLLLTPAASAQKLPQMLNDIGVQAPELFRLGADSLLFRSHVSIPGRALKGSASYRMIYFVTVPGSSGSGRRVTLQMDRHKSGRQRDRRERRKSSIKRSRNTWQFADPRRQDTLPILYTVHIPRWYTGEREELHITLHPAFRPRSRKEWIDLQPREFRVRIQSGLPAPPAPEAMRYGNDPMSMEKIAP